MGSNADAEGKPKPKRRANFTASEDEALINEVERRKTCLFGALSERLTKSVKDKEWKTIAEIVSRVSSVKRFPAEIKQRWKNVKSKSKKTLGKKMNPQFMKKTGGGGGREPLNSSDVRLLGIIGQSSVCGVNGGFDTSTIAVVNVLPETSNSAIPWVDEVDSDSSVNGIVHYVGTINEPGQLEQDQNQQVDIREDDGNVTPTAEFTPRQIPKTDTAFIRKPRENTNTTLLAIQKEILTEIKGLKEVSKERLLVEKKRLDVANAILNIKRQKLLLAHPEID